MRNRLAAMLAALMLVTVFFTAAVCAHAQNSQQPAFSCDWRFEKQLYAGEIVRLNFVPQTGGIYDVYAYPSDSGMITRAMLYRGGTMIADGSGENGIITADIVAGERYELVLQGVGDIEVELMRRAEGRSIFLPADQTEAEAGGMIVRSGNAMWYRLDMGVMNAGIYVLPDSRHSMELEAQIYTADGVLAAESSAMPGGACSLYIEPEVGEDYFLRIAAPDGGTGRFSVDIMLTGETAPDSVEIVTGNITMRKGDVRSLRAKTRPLDADEAVMWISSDLSVAEVSSRGVVTAVGVGTAQISVYAFGGMSAAIDVTVENVEPEYIAYRGDSIAVRVGDVLTPVMTVYPAAAANDENIVYSTSDSETVAVSDTGEISALKEGTAVITASYGDLKAEITVYVDEAPTRYRALLISEQNYARDVNTVRDGAVNTVYNIESLMNTASIDGETFDVTLEIDLTAGEAVEAIQRTFAGAQDKDVSILYITCHGYYRDGMTILQFRDGSELAACDLEAVLRNVPGTVVILADCCDSGGLIGTYEDSALLSGGIVNAFAGEGPAFMSSKYKVIASAGLGQDSYRLGVEGDENKAATVFARALCDALGWDIDDQRRGPLNADANYDGSITLWEAYLYTRRRVSWYLDQAGGDYVQNVQVFPEGDMFVLFER